MVTLHIGVSPELQASLVRVGTPGIREFATRLGVSLVSEPDMLEDFGILTGRAPASRMAEIAAVEGVEFVTPDRQRQVASAA